MYTNENHRFLAPQSARASGGLGCRGMLLGEMNASLVSLWWLCCVTYYRHSVKRKLAFRIKLADLAFLFYNIYNR